jgi:hypothetical protein
MAFIRLDSNAQSMREPVIATLECSGIPPNEMYMFGGGVLALAGIRPAADVDIVVSSGLFHELNASRRLRSSITGEEGLALTAIDIPGAHRRLVTSPNSPYLPLDINMIVEWGDDDTGRSLHFYDEIRNTEITPEGFRHLPLAVVMQRKSTSLRPKDQLDRIRVLARGAPGLVSRLFLKSS